MELLDFNPGMVPDNDEVARLSPGTSEGLEEMEYLTQSARGKGKSEEGGNFTLGSFSEKCLEVKTGEFFCLHHIDLSRDYPSEWSHELNQNTSR